MTDFARINREVRAAEKSAFKRLIELVEQATYNHHEEFPRNYTHDEIQFMQALVRLIDDRIVRAAEKVPT